MVPMRGKQLVVPMRGDPPASHSSGPPSHPMDCPESLCWANEKLGSGCIWLSSQHQPFLSTWQIGTGKLHRSRARLWAPLPLEGWGCGGGVLMRVQHQSREWSLVSHPDLLSASHKQSHLLPPEHRLWVPAGSFLWAAPSFLSLPSPSSWTSKH